MMLNGTYDCFIIITGNLGILLGMTAGWGLYGLFVRDKEKIWGVSAYSFLIFACHHPLVNTIKKLILKLIGVSEASSLFTFFAGALLSIGIILAAGWLLKKYMNPVWKFVTGGRN